MTSRDQARAPDDVDETLVDPRWLEMCRLEEMRVVGIDPGIRDMVTGAVSGDTKEDPQVFR